ncbi:MAG TPA: hypothetical protein DCR40_00220 [Prolixibacteraceae bacterium]|nr:hypothetical protein [Prolixibacteraceae bacterium]
MRIFTLISVLFFSYNVLAQITTWQAPEGFASNKYYQVKVNGTPVPVFDTPVASYAVFDFSGEVSVEVNTMYNVRWVDIRPLRTGLKPEYTGDNSFRFKLNKPENLSLELNGRIRQQPLFIFAGKQETNQPSKCVLEFNLGKCG